MTVDATHPGCFIWRGQLHVTAGDRDLAIAETTALEQWMAGRDDARTAVPDDGAPAVPVLLAVVGGTVLGIAAGAGLGVLTGSTVLGGVAGTVVAVVLAIAGAIAAAGRRGSSALEGRVRATLDYEGRRPPPRLTQRPIKVPPRIARAAPADCSTPDLVRWVETIPWYEGRVASLPAARESVAQGEWALPLPRRDDFHDPRSLWNHERRLRDDRAAYVESCAQVGIGPVDEPSDLALGPEPDRVRPGD